ncbi:hypothetical protein [Streptomyces sp. NPDC012888]|uniref:hypothetical protein n=1 Tax=Streptomyces sp. NPDC012888 TaxID=3364855 RepID=UPI00367919E6
MPDPEIAGRFGLTGRSGAERLWKLPAAVASGRRVRLARDGVRVAVVLDHVVGAWRDS